MAYVTVLAIGLTSNQFFSLWLFLEVRSLIFLFIVFLDEDRLQWDAATSYFLIQAFGSLLFLISALAGSVRIIRSLKMVLVIRVIVKLGSAPVHWWVIRVFKNFSYQAILLISVPQKLLPLFALEITAIREQKLKLFLFNLFFSTLILPQTRVKIVLAFSSLFGVAWILLMAPLYLFRKLVLIYFMVIGLIVVTRNLNSSPEDIRQEYRLSSYLNLVAFLSLAGMPPFPGFFLKLIILQAILRESGVLATLFILVSSVNFYGYFKVLVGRAPESSHTYFETLIFKHRVLCLSQIIIWLNFIVLVL